MNRLTDNEKAATFIGWQGQHVCTNDRHEKMGDSNGYMRCLECPSDAPDMSDPRNYMKALEQGMEFDLECSRSITTNKPKWKSRFNFGYWHAGGTAAESIIKALAARYDAEHSDD